MLQTGGNTKSPTRIYIHFIWGTKDRQRVLTRDARNEVEMHIREYSRRNNIFVIEVGGYIDHLHLLVDLPPTRSPSEVINLIKGESSHWINENNIVRGKFVWQKRYSAFSVSASQREKVVDYILRQEE
ncbi:MAG: IS200/IS605 family transposase, partial [Aliifodinibius sp.]|nr:IS200/IS605 family transposase [Fodinibius sp.]NIV12729.1 IS200/IS605 family transposase [Fodinibius sp.]NIY26444.1 IS200/IS605 family transposase [Fodinibius sp.]